MEFISDMPEGYKTLVGHNGVKLSGGQRQRICLARALAQQPKILVLDEATSSLDSHSEEAIQKAISKLRKDMTIVVVAHRLSTILDADKIVLVRQGKIAEIGTTKELLRKKGPFKRMYDKQMRK